MGALARGHGNSVSYSRLTKWGPERGPLPAAQPPNRRAQENGGCSLGAPAISSFSAAQPRTTLPALMHEVHTLRRLRWDTPTLAWTVWMFGFHRRLVRRWECETDLPKPGPLPQTSHTAATSNSSGSGSKDSS